MKIISVSKFLFPPPPFGLSSVTPSAVQGPSTAHSTSLSTLLPFLLFVMLSCVDARVTLQVLGGGVEETNGEYVVRSPKLVPAGFTKTCDANGWVSLDMWNQLTDGDTDWYEHENGSYIYRNVGDGQWWIDAPDGGGVYVAKGSPSSIPQEQWQVLRGAKSPAPTVHVLRREGL